MSFLLNLLYGVVAGFAEFMPISSSAHRQLFANIFGTSFLDPVLKLFTHVAILLALLFAYYPTLARIRRDKRRIERSHDRNRTYYDSMVVKSAFIPLLTGFLTIPFLSGLQNNLLILALFSLINGIILFIPSRMLQGNKTGKAMSGFDSLLIGIGGALSVLPGISRTGSCISFATARAADPKEAVHWTLLLSLPALTLLCVFDIIEIFNSVSAFSFYYLLSALGAFCGAFGGISLIRSLTAKRGISGFAYYSWGIALLACLLYLVV